MNINEGFRDEGFKSPFAGVDKIDQVPEYIRPMFMTVLIRSILGLVRMMSERNLVELEEFLARHEVQQKCPQAIRLSQNMRLAVRLLMYFRTECETRLLDNAAMDEIKKACTCGNPKCICSPCTNSDCPCHGKGHKE